MKNRLKKKSLKKVKKIFFLVALVIAIYLLGISWKVPGILSKTIFIIGIILLIKAFLFLRGKAAERLVNFWVGLPDNFYRIIALFFIAMGILIFIIR